MVGNNCYPWFSRGDTGSMLVLFNIELGHIPLQTNLLRIKLRCSAGSNPFEALLFFRLLPSNCLNLKIYCDEHSSLWGHVLFSLEDMLTGQAWIQSG